MSTNQLTPYRMRSLLEMRKLTEALKLKEAYAAGEGKESGDDLTEHQRDEGEWPSPEAGRRRRAFDR